MWAYAKEESAKKQMRSCYENSSRRDDYASELNTRFSREKQYEIFVSHLNEFTECEFEDEQWWETTNEVVEYE